MPITNACKLNFLNKELRLKCLCKETTDSTSDCNTVQEFCTESTSSNESVFNFLFNKNGAFWEQIRRENLSIFEPKMISVNQQLMGDLEGFILCLTFKPNEAK